MTQYSLAMAVLWGTVFLAAAAFLTKSKWFIQQFGTSGFLAIMLAGTVRLLLPLEFPQTPVLRDTAFTPFLLHMLRGTVSLGAGISFSYGQLIFFTWGIGTVLYLVVLAGRILFQHLRLSKMHFTESEQYSRIMRQLHGGDRCRILVCEEISSPILVGLFHPCILMPDISISDGHARFILQHELQHNLHKDLWKKVLCTVFCSVFWWNPLTYMIRRKLDYILELNCDQRVLEEQSEEMRIEYAEATLCILKQVKCRKKSPQYSIAFADRASSGQLAKRCELILYPPKASWMRPVLFPVLAGLLIFSYTFVLQPYSPAPPDDYVEITAENSYLQEQSDGSFTLIINGENWGNVSPENFCVPPYCGLPVRKNTVAR